MAQRAVALFSAWCFESLGLGQLRLRAHRDNIASQRVALRAGFERAPEYDTSQRAKGEVWPMLGYSLAGPPSAG